MKYLKYSQYLYLMAGIAFGISAAYKYFNQQEYGLQLLISIAFIIMFYVRKSFVNKMQNNSKNY
jgi:uncharacterized membrane protein